MNRKVVIVLVVAGVLLVGGILFALGQNVKKETTNTAGNPTPSQTTTPASGNNNTAENQNDTNDTAGTTIIFTNNGFSPRTYSIKVGKSVTVRNDSSARVQFSSDDHPTHRKEPELNLSVLAPGESASFTPTRVGTWGFHDHINASYTGSLTVTE